MPAGRPHGALLALLCAALTALPLASALGLGEVGGYRMFARLRRVRLELVATTATGETRIGADELAPHLRADARRILGAALGPGTLADTAVASIRAAAGPLAELGCALDPLRTSVRARVVVLDRGTSEVEETVRACRC